MSSSQSRGFLGIDLVVINQIGVHQHLKFIMETTLPAIPSSYIANSLKLVEQGCYSSAGKLNIDNYIGDYRMGLFRLRQKRKYLRDQPTAFNPEFRLIALQKGDSLAQETNLAIMSILETPNQHYVWQCSSATAKKEKSEGVKKFTSLFPSRSVSQQHKIIPERKVFPSKTTRHVFRSDDDTPFFRHLKS